MVSFYGMGYAGLLLYIACKQMAINGHIYSYTAYHKSKLIECRVLTVFCILTDSDLFQMSCLLLHPQLGLFYCNPETPTQHSALVSDLDCWMKVPSFSFDL